jgi:hypothetical protein
LKTGQSGETFLAAVEFLDLYQPPFAIFENVDGAPWEKMQEYIQGRISLQNRNSNKAISTKNQKARKDSEYQLFVPLFLIFTASLNLILNLILVVPIMFQSL